MRENLRINFLGIEMPNPFMLASAPPRATGIWSTAHFRRAGAAR